MQDKKLAQLHSISALTPRGFLNGPQLLRDWMDRSGLNQQDTAARLSMDKTMLCKILAGKQVPGLKTAVWMERVTGIAVEAWVPIQDGGLAQPSSGLPSN
jgi:transcriptional regulator with XRE-family HTH domain